MKKLIFVLLLSCIFILSFTGCESENTDTDISQSPVPENVDTISAIYGNTSGNLSNGGYFAIKDDSVYFRNPNINNGLCKMAIDGDNIELLTTDKASFINVIGDWIYYRNWDDNHKLYKVRTDGSDKQRIADEKADNISVIDDWIFYSHKENNRATSLCKIGVDGQNKKRIFYKAGVTVTDIFVSDGWIYFNALYRGNRESEFYKIRTDGSEGQILLTGIVSGHIEVDDWIFFQDKKDDYKLYRMKTDGTEKIKITDVRVVSINCDDKWIYFETQKNGSYFLNKVDFDGTNSQIIFDEALSTYNLFVGEDRFYVGTVSNKDDFDYIKANGVLIINK